MFGADDRYFLSSEEAFDRIMEKSVQFFKISKELNITDKVDQSYFRL